MKIYLDSIGCRLNQSEIEAMASQFRAAGHHLVPSAQMADWVVVNTCTVTSNAASESRRRVRQAYLGNPEARICLTGCWSTMEPEAAWKLPGVVKVVPNSEKDHLVSQVLGGPERAPEPHLPARTPVPGNRRRTRAFIKVQDGCDNHCTFCVTTLARGSARSLAPARVVDSVRAALLGGAKEVVLSGVQLSAYGLDLKAGIDLTTLVQRLLEETEVPRLRLSSLEPWGSPPGFLSLWESPRMCRHLHLPLQSGCQRTLRRMGRPITPEAFDRVVTTARESIPDLSVTTDLMVGFPGERRTDFEESLDFVRSMHFAGAHVFVYSPRPETPAFHLPDRVPHKLKRQRGQRMREVVAQAKREHQSHFLGRRTVVLWESGRERVSRGWRYRGWTDHYLRVLTTSTRDLQNRFIPVRLLEVQGEHLRGVIRAEESSTGESCRDALLTTENEPV